MIHLLDANVLIALGDENHPHNAAALRFMEETGIRQGWASCPLTENAFLRVLGQHRIGGVAPSIHEVRVSLLSIIALPGHQFWSDDLTLADVRTFPILPSPKELTDFYLLALAVKSGGKLATFDQRIDPSLVPGGKEALAVISGKKC